MRYIITFSFMTVLLMVTLVNFIKAQDGDEIIIFAAASLNDVFTDLASTFEETHPETSVVLNFAGSSTLATQIEQGAPADIFASANEIQMQQVVEGGFVDKSRVVTFALNRLTIIAPADNPANIHSLDDLASSDIALVIATEGVPIRQYTDGVIEAFAEDNPTLPESIMANVVSEESNVRQIVTRIVLGEADAGFVYQTDVRPEMTDVVTQILIPDPINPIAEYFIAPLTDTASLNRAKEFVEFVLSEEGRSILIEWEFCVPEIGLSSETSEETADVTPEATEEPKPICEVVSTAFPSDR